MKALPLLLCLLIPASFALAASTPAPKKKASTPKAEKTKAADEDSGTSLKPFVTPSPAKKKTTMDDESTPSPTKKKAAASGDDATPTPAKKKSTPSSDEATPVPGKKKAATEDATPSPKKKKTPSEDETPSAATKKYANPTKDDPDETDPKTATFKSATPTPAPKTEHAPAATLEPGELKEFAAQPARVQQLIIAALALTKLNLTYTFGSADPARGGMDCSGTIYRVLRDQGFTDVPRDSSGQYVWTRKAGRFFPVLSTQADGFEFDDLQPGDLMFWTGTYQTGRDIPISHVMLYLGREKKTGKRVMFGASDGRSYAGVQRWGVSVFDFKMPKADPNNPEKKVDFVGYGPIPGLR
jgi:cell wall-associated NlpC family hydrolase